MSKPTEAQREAAREIVVDGIHVRTLHDGENMREWCDCRLTDVIAQALADQAVDAEKLWEACEANYMGGYGGAEYEAFKHGMRTVCNAIAGKQAIAAMRKRSGEGEVDAE